MVRFDSLSKRQRHFHNFTGLSVPEFQQLTAAIKAVWQAARAAKRTTERVRKAGGGRKLKLDKLEDRLLVFLLYARLYPSYLLLEHLFGADESNICRIIKELAPLLSAHQIVINRRPGKKITTLEELRQIIPDLDEVLIDSTEQRIPRPQRKRTRKKYHSGKKKAFTLKTQLMADKRGLILHASHSIPGRPHDYRYFKQTPIPRWLAKNPDITGYGDAGYQGVNKDYPTASFIIPFKRTRAKPELTRSEKIQNTKQRRKRVIIEHAISRLKKFRILADIYRNGKGLYSAIFQAICFLANLRLLARQTV